MADARDVSPLQPGTRIDRYVIEAVLGRGAFTTTYEVRDDAQQAQLVLREYAPEGWCSRATGAARIEVDPAGEEDFRQGLDRFRDEARWFAAFSHPNILCIRHVLEANGTFYTVLDLPGGPTLERWLQGLDTPPTQDELDLIAGPLLGALEHLHDKGTWHLEVTPENILIRTRDGAPVLINFSASRSQGDPTPDLPADMPTNAYSAPEQFISKPDRLGPWSDIYGLAGTLYRALSGSTPEPAPMRVLSDMRPAVQAAQAACRPGFLEAVDWGLRLQAQDRPQSIAAWRARLLAGSGVAQP